MRFAFHSPLFHSPHVPFICAVSFFFNFYSILFCGVKYIPYFCGGCMPEVSGYGLLSEILAFAIILYRLLKLRNFQDNTIGIRLQMPAHSVGASYPLYYRVS